MLAWQYEAGVSIFGCDEYAVYSSKAIKLATGVASMVVQSDLKCDRGGEFKTALNTDIFLAVWARVVGDGRYHIHDWTVKADADAVFFPARLRGVVVRQVERPGGVYINNCRLGMHGPLEVLSRNAVRAWARGSPRCVLHFTRLCAGPCMRGEDRFLDQCLQVLGVDRHNEYGLLLEDQCSPPVDWQSCRNATVAGFHPFKSLEQYQGCVARASA